MLLLNVCKCIFRLINVLSGSFELFGLFLDLFFLFEHLLDELVEVVATGDFIECVCGNDGDVGHALDLVDFGTVLGEGHVGCHVNGVL